MEPSEPQPEKTENTETTEVPETKGFSPEKAKAQKPDSSKDNVVFIGNKRIMNYVNSIGMQLSKEENPNVVIKARGKFISKAADIVEVARRRFSDQGVKINDIRIGTEEYESEGKKIRVSTIDITLSK